MMESLCDSEVAFSAYINTCIMFDKDRVLYYTLEPGDSYDLLLTHAIEDKGSS